jgi:hypothetical protein
MIESPTLKRERNPGNQSKERRSAKLSSHVFLRYVLPEYPSQGNPRHTITVLLPSMPSTIGRTKLAHLNVRESNSSIRISGRKHGGVARSSRARSSGNTRCSCICSRRIWSIEPLHSTSTIHPNAKNEHHTTAKSMADGRHATSAGECISAAENLLLRSTVVSIDVVLNSHAGDVDGCVSDDFLVLNIDSVDGRECSGVSAVRGDELGNDSEWFPGIDYLVRAVEVVVSHTVCIVVTSIFVTDSGVVVGGSASAIGSLAGIYTRNVAWMGSEGSSG